MYPKVSAEFSAESSGLKGRGFKFRQPDHFLSKNDDYSGFCLLYKLFWLLIFGRFILTLTRPISEKFAEVPGWFARYFRVLSLDFLHCPGHEAAHPLGGVFLHLVGDVGVGVKGEPSAVVAQDTGDRFDVHALLDRQCRESVSETVERDAFGDSGFFQQGFVQPLDAIRAVELARHWGGEHDGAAGMFAVLREQ